MSSNNNVNDVMKERFFTRLLNINNNNNICADCGNKGATWASLGFGVFVCLNCSGPHRSLGMHITRVRSTKLDNWVLDDMQIMENLGNDIANNYYMFDKIKNNSNHYMNISQNIRQKYVLKNYSCKHIEEPIKCYLKNKTNFDRNAYLNIFSTQNNTNNVNNNNKIETKNNNDNIDLLNFTDNNIDNKSNTTNNNNISELNLLNFNHTENIPNTNNTNNHGTIDLLNFGVNPGDNKPNINNNTHNQTIDFFNFQHNNNNANNANSNTNGNNYCKYDNLNFNHHYHRYGAYLKKY